ncbi:MAG: hypothetical protein H8E12_17090 [Rhodobacteraceae bacterium]|nr:hypothetical protein [Paracoccaceae bacterium]
MTEEYWKRNDGEVIAVSDMNEYHAKNALRKLIRYRRTREAQLNTINNVIHDKKHRTESR